MKINKVRLADFRNISFLELDLCETANIIYGDNGQGKTNFIEAVWMFTGAKSFRGAKDRELIRFGAENAVIEMDFFAQEREQTAKIIFDSKRSISLNEIDISSSNELAGRFCAVVFSPNHLTLIKNGPQEKRKFIDTSICQIKPKYIHILGQFQRVLDQRNKLLKDISYAPALMDTLEIWDRRFVSFAAVVIKTRASFTNRLRPYAAKMYEGISHQREVLDFYYASSLACDPNADIPVIESQLMQSLAQKRADDLRMGITSYGPHRDDIEITLDEKSARIYASQGQQRSCVLSLKLAECEIVRETIGEYPVILLDDVMSELDISRRDFLLNHLQGRQLIMTCCDKAYFKTLGKGIGAKMQDGAVLYSRKY